MIVSVNHLKLNYGEQRALEDVSFEVAAGELFGILGPNGSGKSTMFRVLATIETPQAGTANIAGLNVVTQAQEVRKRIGVVFQTQSLDKYLTVAENLTSQGHLFGMSGAKLKSRISDLLERLQISDRRDSILKTLSGGMKRRVEIAKALLHEPQVLLMDEPTTGLDPVARMELWKYVDELRRQTGVTVVVTTHLLEEAERASRLMLMHMGVSVLQGTPRELKASIPGDVVLLESADPESLRQGIFLHFDKQKCTVFDNYVRTIVPDGPKFVVEAAAAFQTAVQGISYHKPTLEDVFMKETGARL